MGACLCAWPDADYLEAHWLSLVCPWDQGTQVCSAEGDFLSRQPGQVLAMPWDEAGRADLLL